ncbi:MAG TPA: hypothetical protein VHS03_01085 [Gaiellaceae bacterium]|jgi:hypothetical protein|nr:hypothetical protein [Gaiellaceae bacterium]
MLDLTGTPAIDVLIGLAFFFFLLSIICSAVNEGIATALNLRAKDLENGIRSLLDDPQKAQAFFKDPRVAALFKPGRFLGGFPWVGKRRPFGGTGPSYIPPRVFALTFLDTFAPPASGVASANLVTRATAAVQGMPDGTVKKLLQDALNEAGGDIEKVRSSLENGFNEAMDRVSGWYKRRVQLILFLVGLVVVGLFNADSYAVGKMLWQNDAVRSAVVQQATQVASSGKSKPACQSGSSAQQVANCVSAVKQLGLPLGWSKATEPKSWQDAFGKIGGLLLTAFAILLGAPFWFDTLSKLAQLRGSGKSPDDKNSSTKPATN